MISVVIRNKNEASALFNVLSILKKEHDEDISEIIIVDNESTDDSIKIATQFNCKIITIKNFTYGKAINLGVNTAENNYVLLLSSHAIPIGKSFFKYTLKAVNSNDSIAGVRYVSSIEDVKRAISNNYEVKDPINYGLMAACCLINKKVWLDFKFNEDLMACEDKEWSQRVINGGFKILNLNESFIYFANRDLNASVKRYKNEKEANLILTKKKTRSKHLILLSFIKRIIVTNTRSYLMSIKRAYLLVRAELEIYNNLNKK